MTLIKVVPPRASEKIYWADKIAECIVAKFPREKEYVLAAGITPSGPVHVGNLREVMTTYFVYRALKDRGVKAKFVLFWDDYDRLRKVPQNIPNRELIEKHIGKPISEIPDPFGTHTSYAEHFEKEFEEALEKLGIKPDLIVRQSGMYKERKYLPYIKKF